MQVIWSVTYSMFGLHFYTKYRHLYFVEMLPYVLTDACEWRTQLYFAKCKS